jgi:indole-3-glycerol phosphate synthase
MNKLTEICEVKLEHIKKQKAKIGFSSLEDIARYKSTAPRGFVKALRHKENIGQFGLIAELKKASPSKGLIRSDFALDKLATAYKEGGATCISVLTDEPYFQGADEYVAVVKDAVNLPVLRKDFMLDPYQIVESRTLGADCILLIMACLSDAQAAELEAAALEFGMDVLIEVHDHKELERALKHLKSPMIGVNNRDLKTLQIDLNISRTLSKIIPAHYLKVCESGIGEHKDLLKMREHGFNTFLVGESLMKQDDVLVATQRLLQG